MRSTPTALVAAAPTLLRQGLVALLHEQWPQLLLTLTVDTRQLALLMAQHSFRLVVLDGSLVGSALPELLALLHQAQPLQRLVLFTDQPLRASALGRLVRSDTHLCLSWRVAPGALTTSLAAWLGPPHALPAAEADVSPDLTGFFSRRELEVLRLVVADQCNEEIAERLCLSVRTVESHRRALIQKAGTRTLVGLAARAVREGWVT